MKKPVLTKRDFYRRFSRGEFGNTGMNWPTLSEWRGSGYNGDIGIRTKGVGTRCDYNVPHAEVESRYWDFRRTYAETDINLSAMMPGQYMKVQGELCRTFRGLEFFGSTVKNLPMRPALRNHGFYLEGLQVELLIRWACDATSYDWLKGLLDDYPDHTIEFSALEIPWGTLNLNTVIWEVRKY